MAALARSTFIGVMTEQRLLGLVSSLATRGHLHWGLTWARMNVLVPADVLVEDDKQALDVRGAEQRLCDGSSSRREQHIVQPG